MRIEFETPLRESIRFGDINRGTAFRVQGSESVFVKLDTEYMIVGGGRTFYCNAVQLGDGALKHFANEINAIPLPDAVVKVPRG